jgi:segregation and condensation protein A
MRNRRCRAVIDENKLIKSIVLGSDWQEVLANLVVEEGMDPLSVDIVRLADSFMLYLNKLKEFDFRVPARFILIAAILLRMKCELLLEEEMKKEKIEGSAVPELNVEVPILTPPITRKTTRKVTLDELITALNKAFTFKEKKETKRLRIRKAAEQLIEPAEDIELKIKEIFNEILKGKRKFSDIVPVWRRKDIVTIFMPLLYLTQRGKISCEQEEFFKEIYIKLR